MMEKHGRLKSVCAKKSKGYEIMSACERIERKILLLSFIAGALFSLVEFIMAITSRSQSVLMDAAYDASELIVIGLTLFLMPLFHKPLNEKHPFGYAQVESIFIIVKGLMMTSVTIGLSVNSIQLALSGGNAVNGRQISFFQIILGLISLMVLLTMCRHNRSVSSPTIDAEIKGWKIDVGYSLGMAVAFFLSTLLKNTPMAPILPYFDQIVAVGIVVFMLPEMLRMVAQAIRDVFLFAPEQEIVDTAKALTMQVLENYPFTPTFFDITRTGRRLWVAVYFCTSEPTLSMADLKAANEQLNAALDEAFDNCDGELIATAK